MAELRNALPSLAPAGAAFHAVCNLAVDDLAFVKADLVQWIGYLATTKPWGGHVDPLDVVVSRDLLASPDDALELCQLMQRIYKGFTIPRRREGLSSIFKHASVTRGTEKKGGTIVGGKEIVHRACKNRTFGWFAPMLTVWPPPIICGPESLCGALWHVKVVAKEGLSEDDAVAHLVASLQTNYVGFFLRSVRGYTLYAPSCLTWGHLGE